MPSHARPGSEAGIPLRQFSELEVTVTRKPLFILILIAAVQLAFSAGASLEGKWTGSATLPPEPAVPFSLEFKRVEGSLKGTIDLPEMGMYGLELQDVSYQEKVLKFVVPVPDSPAKCTARLQEDGTIDGEFEQFGQKGTFQARRQEK